MPKNKPAPDFISDKDMAAATAPDFISDDQMAKARPAPEELLSQKGALAASTGFLQAATFGHQPQLQAITDPVTDRLYNLFAEQKVSAAPWKQMVPGSKEYITARDAAIREQQALEKQSPIAYKGGEIAGLLGTAALPGMAAGKAVQAGRYGQAALTGAKAGAITGLLQNPGDIEGQASPQLGERLGGAAYGAATGAAIGGAGEALAQGARFVGKIPQKLRDFSDEMAFRQLGPTKKIVKQMIKADKGETYKGMRELGRFVREKGIVRGGENIEDVATRVSSAADKTGQQIGDVYDRISQQLGAVDPKALSKKARQELLSTNLKPGLIAKNIYKDIRDKYTGASGGREAISAVERELTNLKDLGAEAVSINKVFNFRKGLDKKIYDKSTDNVTKDALIDLRRALQKTVDDRIAAVDKIFGSKETAALKALNKDYGMLARARDMTKDQLARNASNQFFSLTDKIIGAGALASQLPSAIDNPEQALKGAALGLLSAGGSRLARRAGAPFAMKGAELSGAAIQQIGKAVRANLDNVTPEALKRLNAKFQERYGKELADKIFKNPGFYGALGVRATDSEVKRSGTQDNIQ